MNKIFIYLLSSLFIFIIGCTPKMNNTDSSKSPEEIRMEDVQKLQGKWKLKAIKFMAQDEIIIPTKDYFIAFTDRKINFNLEVNDCFTKYKIMDPGTILIVDTMGCTKKCCDKDISDKLEYNKVHTYTFKKNKLTLLSDDKKFEFDLVNQNK